MEPLLVAGDKARIAPMLEPCVGDVALVELNDGSVALHRIVDVQGGFLVTKGDFTGRFERVGTSDVIGIASEFSLDGENWVVDKRTTDEILYLVRLSKQLSYGDGDSRLCQRASIWELNEDARRRMLAMG